MINDICWHYWWFLNRIVSSIADLQNSTSSRYNAPQPPKAGRSFGWTCFAFLYRRTLQSAILIGEKTSDWHLLKVLTSTIGQWWHSRFFKKVQKSWKNYSIEAQRASILWTQGLKHFCRLFLKGKIFWCQMHVRRAEKTQPFRSMFQSLHLEQGAMRCTFLFQNWRGTMLLPLLLLIQSLTDFFNAQGASSIHTSWCFFGIWPNLMCALQKGNTKICGKKNVSRLCTWKHMCHVSTSSQNKDGILKKSSNGLMRTKPSSVKTHLPVKDISYTQIHSCFALITLIFLQLRKTQNKNVKPFGVVLRLQPSDFVLIPLLFSTSHKLSTKKTDVQKMDIATAQTQNNTKAKHYQEE